MIKISVVHLVQVNIYVKYKLYIAFLLLIQIQIPIFWNVLFILGCFTICEA